MVAVPSMADSFVTSIDFFESFSAPSASDTVKDAGSAMGTEEMNTTNRNTMSAGSAICRNP